LRETSMPAVSLTPSDLKPFATIPPDKAQAMCDDALAIAAVVAPCILDPRFQYADAALAIIREAVLRWHAAGTGGVTSQTAGPFGITVDTNYRRSGMFTPAEIALLQSLCRDNAAGGGAWNYDTVAARGTLHAKVCSVNFVDGHHCTCGATITPTGQPLWGY